MATPERIDAIILAGGKGTRLASVLPDAAKCLAPIESRRFLDYLIDFLVRSEVVARIILALGHHADQVVRHIETYPSFLPVIPVIETHPLGTGGALLNVLDHVSSDRILVMNGDTLVNLTLRDLLDHHKASRNAATLAVIAVADAGRYGSVALDANRVTGFKEKQPGAGFISTGIGVFEMDALRGFAVEACSLERDIIPRLVAAREVGAMTVDAGFIDIGLPETYGALADFLGGLGW